MYMNTVTAQKEVLASVILKAVIIYDDFDSAAHATGLLERVGMRANEAIKWDIKPWRCDVLKQPTLAALTIAVAAHADLIVLALQRIHVPPPELLEWLRHWAKHRRIEDAAVLSLQAESGAHPATAWNEIKTFLEKQHLTFLGNHRVAPHNRSSSFIHRLQPHKPPVAPALSRAQRLSIPQPQEIND